MAPLVITSNELRKAAARANTGEAVTMLISIKADGLADVVRVTDCNKETFGFLPGSGRPVQGLTVNKVRYQYLPFRWVLPDIVAGENNPVKISIDNLDKEMVAAIRNTRKAPYFEVRVVLVSQPTVTEYYFPEMRMVNATYNPMVIEGSLAVDTYLTRLITREKFGPSRYFSLFKGVS